MWRARGPVNDHGGGAVRPRSGHALLKRPLAAPANSAWTGSASAPWTVVLLAQPRRLGLAPGTLAVQGMSQCIVRPAGELRQIDVLHRGRDAGRAQRLV